MNAATITLDCGHVPTETTGCGTGYATTHDGRTLCYTCADDAQRANVAAANYGDRITGYLSDDGATWQTWTGGHLGRVVRSGAHHAFSAERYHVRVKDTQGRIWSGTGAPGMWATLRLTRL